MYGIFSYIYHSHQPNVAKYTIHGSYELEAPPGDRSICIFDSFIVEVQ